MFFSYKCWRDIRYSKVLPYLDGNILELGCGGGFIPKYLQTNQSIQEYTGIDYDKDCIKKLKEDFPKYTFFQQDLDEQMDLGDKKFDTVISSAVIEHIYNQKQFFHTATKNLKIGGRLIITSPSVFGNDFIYPLICKLGLRPNIGALSDHIVIYNKDRFKVAANDFKLQIDYFKYFELFCNQIIVFTKQNNT